MPNNTPPVQLPPTQPSPVAAPIKLKGLRARAIRSEHVTPEHLQSMWNLFDRYYEDTSFERFKNDLSKKDHVIILEAHGEVLGFTTVQFYDSLFEGKTVRVVYSGDTVKDRRVWGEKKLNVSFALLIAKDFLRNLGKPYYWFLISKGFKTYLVLTNKFPNSWPRHDRPTPQFEDGLLAHLACAKFGESYFHEQGVLRFSTPMGRLKDDAVPITERDLENPDIRYFHERNPEYLAGTELCCLAKLDAPLWIKTLHRGLRILFKLQTPVSKKRRVDSR